MESFEALSSLGLRRACRRAARLRDGAKGRSVSFSPKVFIPLTRLCRDRCAYCTYRTSPRLGQDPFLTLDEVIRIAQAGEAAGCREALFVLGERPEERYESARRWLAKFGFSSSVDYLAEACRRVLEETALLPHSNPGTLSRNELARLRPLNASMGLMLENVSPRLGEAGGPHEHAPSKRPEERLKTLDLAGEMKIPFTTGILIGIGETRRERYDSLLAIRELQRRHGHIQEVIIQNFRRKPGTPLAEAPEPSRSEMLETLAWARLVLGGETNIQAPPNLAQQGGADRQDRYLAYLDAGINDWGGISPVTIDHVNPEAPWPHLDRLEAQLRERGFHLRARFPLYPEFLFKTGFVDGGLRLRMLREADADGFVDSIAWKDCSSLRWQAGQDQHRTGGAA